jgi:predicted transcriptional regulator
MADDPPRVGKAGEDVLALEPVPADDRLAAEDLRAVGDPVEQDLLVHGGPRVEYRPTFPFGCLVAGPPATGYTSGMKTAISLPDAIFRDAERLAKRLKKSRSKLYTEAVVEYVARHEPEAITEAMNEVAAKLGTRPDEFAKAAARNVLGRSEW